MQLGEFPIMGVKKDEGLDVCNFCKEKETECTCIQARINPTRMAIWILEEKEILETNFLLKQVLKNQLAIMKKIKD